MTCTFCAIAAGDLAAHVVHEDDDFVAFLDARPVFKGHTLLVPRTLLAMVLGRATQPRHGTVSGTAQ